MKVVPLRTELPCDSIVSALRNLASEIEAGDFGLMTTCVVVLGHTGEHRDGEGITAKERHEIFASGPRVDIFTVKGVLATALGDL